MLVSARARARASAIARSSRRRLAAGGAKVDILPLLGVRGVGVRRARALMTAGVASVEALAAVDAARLVSLLGHNLAGPPSYRAKLAEKLIQNGECVERARLWSCWLAHAHPPTVASHRIAIAIQRNWNASDWRGAVRSPRRRRGD